RFQNKSNHSQLISMKEDFFLMGENKKQSMSIFKKTGAVSGAAVILSSTALSGFFSGNASAEDITKYKGAKTINDQTKAPADYSLIGEFGDNTEIKPFGDVKFKDTNWNTNSTADDKEQLTYHFYDAKKMPKDFGVKYTNVGEYDGRSVDMKFTVKGGENFTPNNQLKAVSFSKNDIGFDFTGMEYADVEMEYVWSDNGKPADSIKGQYMNILDIDNSQYVEYDKATSDAIGDDIYVDKTAKMDASKKDGKLKIADLNERKIGDDDVTGHYTVLADTHKLRFKWGRDYDIVAKHYDITKEELRNNFYTM